MFVIASDADQMITSDGHHDNGQPWIANKSNFEKLDGRNNYRIAYVEILDKDDLDNEGSAGVVSGAGAVDIPTWGKNLQQALALIALSLSRGEYQVNEPRGRTMTRSTKTHRDLDGCQRSGLKYSSSESGRKMATSLTSTQP
jgi:hypothetical protein